MDFPEQFWQKNLDLSNNILTYQEYKKSFPPF